MQSSVRKSSVFTCLAAGGALLVLSACTSMSAPAGSVEKKEFTHTKWTGGLFSDAVTVTNLSDARMIFLAGAGSEDENGPRGTIRHKGDVYAQCKYAYDKITRALAAHGAKMSDVVKVTAYVTDMDKRLDYIKCYAEAFQGQPLPAKTLLGVTRLAYPDMLVEVDVTAIVRK